MNIQSYVKCCAVLLFFFMMMPSYGSDEASHHKALESLGRKIQEWSLENQYDKIDEQFDYEALVARMLADETNYDDKLRGRLSSIIQSRQPMAELIKKTGGKLTFKGLGDEEPLPTLRFRLDASVSQNFLAFYPILNEIGEIKLADYYNYQNARDYSQQLFERLKPPADTGWWASLKRSFSGDTAAFELNQQRAAFHQATQDQKFDQVLTQFQALPEAIQNERHVLLEAIQAAIIAGTPQMVRKLTTRYQTNYPADPSDDWLLLPYYLQNLRFYEAQACVQSLESYFGEDVALDNFYASIYMGRGQLSKARQAIISALQRDPNYEKSYWLMLQLNVRESHWGSVARTLDQLLDRFNFYYKDLADNPLFRDFIKSSAYQSWAPLYKTRGQALIQKAKKSKK